MKIIVDKHNIKIVKEEELNENEYKVSDITFEFSEDYTDDLEKVAVFTKNGKTYKQIIADNKCDFPYEILEDNHVFLLGVYAQRYSNDELEIRYSPKPMHVSIEDGSYIKNAENSKPVTPSEFEQYMAILNGKIEEIEALGNEIVEIGNKAEEQGSNAQKIADEVKEKLDSGDFNGRDGVDGKDATINGYNNINITAGTNINITQDEDNLVINNTYSYDDTEIRDEISSSLEESKKYTDKKFSELDLVKIVEELPEVGIENIIYLVPKKDSSNNDLYDEYIFEDGKWEFIKTTEIEIDLTDYVKKTDIASKESTGVVKEGNCFNTNKTSGDALCQSLNLDQYNQVDNYVFMSKGTLENIKDDYVGSSQLVKDLNTNLDNIIPKNSKKGTLVNIDDSLNYKTFETVVDGNSEQFTTTGKNKYDLNNLYGTERKGTWSGVTLNLKPNTSYTISTNMISNPGITPSIGKPVNTNAFIIVSVDSTETENELSSANNGLGTTDNVTKTVTTDSSGYMYIAKKNTANETIDNLISQGGFVQIEEGTVATDYELFTGGIKSPNPDYPQEIEVIKEDFNIISCGKNLLPNNINSQTINGVTITKNDDRSISLNGTSTNYFNLKFTNEQITLPKGTYVQSFHRSGSSNPGDGVFIYSKDDYNNQIFDYSTSNPSIRTLEEATTIVNYSISVNKGTVIDNLTLYPMLEQNLATDYEPYQSSSLNITIPENEFAAKINDVKDQFRINFNEDDEKYHLYLDKKIGRKKLPGDGWKVRAGATKYAYILPNFFEINGSSGQCAHFKFIVKGAFNAQNNECIASASNALGLNLYTNNEKLSTLEKLVTYLQENDVWIYYELENPYTLDLEIVEPLKTNHDINNFFVIANLETDIKVTYALDIKKYVDNKLANISNQILIKGSEI